MKNRDKMRILASIYKKIGKKMRTSVRNRPAKFEVRNLKISRVIPDLRFGHVTSEIRKFGSLRSRDRNFSKIFFSTFSKKYFSNTAQVWGPP